MLLHSPNARQWQAKFILPAILASMAEVCTSMTDLKRIHARAIVTDLIHHAVVLGKVFRFAAVSPFGDLNYADRLFTQLLQPKAFFYNTLIRGYSKSSSPWCSIGLFNQMRLNGLYPDEFTLTFLLKSRSRMKFDMPSKAAFDEIHGVAIKFGFSSCLFVQNALIHLYAARGASAAACQVFEDTVGVDVVSWSGLVMAYVKSGNLDTARRVFYQMPERDVVSWTAMISGYAQAKRSQEALDLFWDMGHAGIRPDEITMVSVISACTNLGDVETGMFIHRYIDENRLGWMVALCNALIDMYAKCGYMEQAWQMFNNMSSKTLVTWNTMIFACANHDDPEYAFYLSECITKAGFLPDGVTFLALLVAYARKGLIDEGVRFFENMQKEHGIEARIEHYGFMVNMLGQAGQLEEAYKLISTSSIAENVAMWESLLFCCRNYHDKYMEMRIIKKLLELKPDEERYQILLHDIYISSRQPTEASEMRETVQADEARSIISCT